MSQEPGINHATDHEESDVSIRGLGTFLVAMTVALIVVGGIVYWQYRRFESLARANDPAPLPRADERRPAPGPNLQIDEIADMRNLRDEQEALLSKTEWVSRDENLVRIPIEQAIEIVAETGPRRWPAPMKSDGHQRDSDTKVPGL